jgi:hypothetical protein
MEDTYLYCVGGLIYMINKYYLDHIFESLMK